MKTTSKLLCLILAIMMMIPLFASCFKNKKPQPENPDVGIEDTRDEVLKMTGLEEKRYDGELFVIGYSFGGGTYISTWVPKPVNVSILDAQSDIVANASYLKDTRFETLTGARISYQGYATNPNVFDSAYSESAKFVDLHSGGLLKDYDLLMFGATTAGKLIQEKVLMNLNEYDNIIHHDQVYYSSEINNQLSMAGKQFVTAGYYTTGNIKGSQVTMVNADALKAQHGSDLMGELYDLALNNQWTLEKMLSYDAGYATGKINGDKTDKYTLVISNYGVENLFYGMGGKLIDKNSQDLPIVTVNTPENQQRLFGIQAHTKTSLVCVAPESGSGQMFIDGQGMFQVGMLGAFGSARRTNDIDECLMPIPMEKAGGKYASFIPSWNANVSGIPAQVADAEMAAYFYELYMALSYMHIYPAYYEKTLRLTYTKNDEEAQIFDMIADSVCLDIAACYSWLNEKNTDIRNMCANKAEVTQTVTNLAATLQNKIDEFLGTYEIN